jgi:hypothetical protein
MQKKWTNEEEKYLKENYKNVTYKKIGEHLGRSKRSVAKKASRLGIKAPYKPVSYWLGKKRSEETKRKISKSTKGKYVGKDNWNYKRKPSEEEIEVRRRQAVEYWKTHKPYNYNKKEYVCKECGKIFKDKPSAKRVFCSKKCLFKAQRNGYLNDGNFKIGENHPFWVKDRRMLISNNRGNWSWHSKKPIFKRDSWTCQECGYKDKEKKGRGLEIDHKIPFCFGGLHTKQNSRTLCVTCHKKKTNMENAKLRKLKKIKKL